MTNYKLYPNLPPWGPETLGPEGPSAPPENPQVAYHLSVIQAKQRGLKNKEQMFKKKCEKYTKILKRLTWSNACLRGIRLATGISSVATFATFVGLPVSAALGAASLTGAIASGIISMLTRKYQKKLKKVTHLIDVIMRTTVVFERVIYSIIDEEEFNTLQTLHLETLNELKGVDRRMEAENRSLVEKNRWKK